MLYLNHAGTSWPKPGVVQEAAGAALHASPADWGEAFHAAHARAASFFGIEDRHRLLLTPGCTSALAVAMADQAWQAGDRIVISHLEHHALHRPAALLEARGVEVVVIPRAADGPLDLDVLERELSYGGVQLVAMTAACNVTGELLPMEDVVARAHAHHAYCLFDGAQVAGWMDLNLAALGVDFFTFAAHKGLQAPWGLGGLYVAPHIATLTPAAVCELPADGGEPDCATMPGYCDVGSADLVALAGLHAALDWLAEPAQADRLPRARAQLERMTQVLEARDDVTLLGLRDPEARLPTVAFTVDGRTSAEAAASLRDAGLMVGSGLQCAPLAHEALRSAPDGAVRISVGPLTTDADVDQACDILRRRKVLGVV